MLLNVFKSCSSVRTVFRNFRLNGYVSSTRGVAKKKENVLFLKVPEMLKEKTTEQVESLKLVPESYRLIYLSKDLKLVAIARIAVFALVGVGIWMGVGIFFKPESIVVRPEFFTKEQTLCIVLVYAIFIYIFATRHVHYIFRNEKSYKTVYYGLFGELQPKIIDHEAKELVLPSRNALLPFLYYLKGKPVIVSQSGFVNKTEYAVLVKGWEEN